MSSFTYERERERDYIERNISMSSIYKPNCEASVPCHCSMNCTLSKKRAVDIVRCIARNGPDHVRRICWEKKMVQVGFYCLFIRVKLGRWKRKNRMKLWRNVPMYLRLMGILCGFEK